MDINDEDARRKQIREIVKQFFLKNPQHFLTAKREVDGLSLLAKFNNGYLTLNDMDWLIQNNLTRAEKCGLRLSWRLTAGAVYGQIFEDELRLYEMRYLDGYVHTRIAQMQFDFDQVLTGWEKFNDELKNGV